MCRYITIYIHVCFPVSCSTHGVNTENLLWNAWRKNSLAINCREVVASNAAIKNGGVVITNGMILVTLEHYTDGVNMKKVRVRGPPASIPLSEAHQSASL